MKQCKCPSTDEWIVYIHTMEYYFAIEKNEKLIDAAKYTKPENIMFSEWRYCTYTQQSITQPLKGTKLGHLERHGWMDPETVIQSKVSQKNKCCILMHICGIWEIKTGIDNLIYKAEIETQTDRTNVRMPRGKEGWDELGDWEWRKFTTDTMHKMGNYWEPIV